MTFAFFKRQRARPSSTRAFLPLSAHPTRPSPEHITVVVPVRDNAAGLERLVRWWSALDAKLRPRELIVVDDGSIDPVRVQATCLRVLRTTGRGPAAARNLGWRASSTEWVAFLDSDCVPDVGWPSAFALGWSHDVAVQGRVRALGSGRLSRFYDAHDILRPMAWTDEGRPGYLITANALVWRPALECIGGFDECFRLAAGEDVDVGLRLAAVGSLRWNVDASVAHDFEESLLSFAKRFVRYGRGNRTLLSRVDPSFAERLRPRPFWARSARPSDQLLAWLAFGCLAAGWYFEGEEE